MTPVPRHSRKPGAFLRSFGGFSLLELLCVIAIMAIMLIATMPALSSLLQSSNLTRGGQIMIDQLSMARQIAAAKNRTVEVRMIKLDPADGGYTGMQLWTIEPSGTAAPVGRVARMPNDIFIAGTALSPLLSGLSGSNMAVAGVANAPYKSFRIRPPGTVEPVLATTNRSNFYFTLVNGRFTNNSTPPDNFVTLQINPDTGNPLLYRP